MTDVVVTVPMGLWPAWIKEGDCPGDPPTGEEWGFFTSGMKPNIAPGDRVYVVAHGKIRGYAPLTNFTFEPFAGGIGHIGFGRKGGAVAVTVPAENITGFRGWRYRWWDRAAEVAFPAWRTP